MQYKAGTYVRIKIKEEDGTITIPKQNWIVIVPLHEELEAQWWSYIIAPVTRIKTASTNYSYPNPKVGEVTGVDMGASFIVSHRDIILSD